MNLREGDVYICMDPCCRAEVEVRRGADDTCPGKFILRCCCGNEMVREDMLEHAGASTESIKARKTMRNP